MKAERITVRIQFFADRPSLQLQWVDAEGHRRTRSAGTSDPDEAEQRRSDLEYELNHGIAVPRRATRSTGMDGAADWHTFRERFEAERAGPLRDNTRRNYRVTLDLLEEICEPSSVRAVDARMVSAFAAGLRKRRGIRGQRQAIGTVKVRLQFLRTVLNWAAKLGYAGPCPEFPPVKVPRRKPKPVPVAVVDALLAAAGDDAQMKVYLSCAWLAGLRLNEALALSWGETDAAPWVDLESKRIWLPAGYVKGDEDQWVPLDAALEDALLALPRQPDGRVFRFTEDRSGKEIGDIAVSARVRELAERAGVQATYRSLRRGFGCRYAGKVPAQVLQKLLRHADIKTTLDYYANVDDAVEEAVRPRVTPVTLAPQPAPGHPAADDATSGGFKASA